MAGMLTYPRPKPDPATPTVPPPDLAVAVMRSDGLVYDFTQGTFAANPPSASGVRNLVPVEADWLRQWLECPMPDFDPAFAYSYLIVNAKTLDDFDGWIPLFDSQRTGEHVASIGPMGFFSRR